MQITKSKASAVENESLPLAILSLERHDFEPVSVKTPLDELLEKEDRDSLSITDREEASIKVEAVSGILSLLFRLTSTGHLPSPLEVLQRLYLLTYTVRPALIQAWSLEQIAKCFDSSRQVFSKQLIKQNKLLGGIKSRNQKPSLAVSRYVEGTKLWHQERARERTALARKEYLRRWRLENRERVQQYQSEYRAKFRERLNAAKRKKRDEDGK